MSRSGCSVSHTNSEHRVTDEAVGQVVDALGFARRLNFAVDTWGNLYIALGLGFTFLFPPFDLVNFPLEITCIGRRVGSIVY